MGKHLALKLIVNRIVCHSCVWGYALFGFKQVSIRAIVKPSPPVASHQNPSNLRWLMNSCVDVSGYFCSSMLLLILFVICGYLAYNKIIMFISIMEKLQ